MKRRSLTTEPDYHGYPINTGENNNLACDTRILDTTERVLDSFLDKHSRVLVARFDFTFPQGYKPDGNEEFKEIMKQTITSEQRHSGSKPSYVAVKEKSQDGVPHYNGLIILDNHVKKSPLNVIKEMERIAVQVIGEEAQKYVHPGIVHLGANPLVVHRGNEEERGEALYRGSYLAKLKDKDDTGREIFCSKTK